MANHAPDIVDYIPQLRRYAFALTYDAEEAEDLVQESLMHTIAKSPSWSEIRRPRAYLFSILHNLHINRRKKAKSRAENLEQNNFDNEGKVSTDPTIAYEYSEALRRIPQSQREVILLIGLAGLTYDEAAAVLEIPTGTVMSRLSRGRRALRKQLDRKADMNMEQDMPDEGEDAQRKKITG